MCVLGYVQSLKILVDSLYSQDIFLYIFHFAEKMH